MQIKPPTSKQLNVFVYGLALILVFFSWKSYRANSNKLAVILMALSFTLLIIYFLKKDFVVQFYKAWMQCASLIGLIISSILMVAIFYFIFSPVGLALRLIRKDILNLNKDPKLKSYWIDRPHREFNKLDYERQF